MGALIFGRRSTVHRTLVHNQLSQDYPAATCLHTERVAALFPPKHRPPSHRCGAFPCMSDLPSFQSQVPDAPTMAARFADYHPPFSDAGALTEANRCLFCFDAPCTQACPTHIDVPRFIKKISTGNLEGSAETILDANILGASCARACPVQVLCEGACVFEHYNQQPIQIGRLQRYAMDALQASGAPLPFGPGEDTGRRVALIGAGPASLACAAELRRRGVAATIYDARPLPGGLNTYGIAEYKLPLRESLREIDLIAQLGVEFRFETVVDLAMLEQLETSYDAIFVGIGLGAIHKLGLEHEDSHGVTNALDWIAEYKSGKRLRSPPRVGVIGAGNTAIDAAIAAVRLGAEEVTMIYRRGPEQMSAFAFEYEHAKAEGVRFLWRMQPVAIKRSFFGHAVEALELQTQEVSGDGSLLPVPGSTTTLQVNCIVLSIGQSTHAEFLESDDLRGPKLLTERGRIVIDRATGQTSNPRYFAGGDCTNGGREVVDAVADGKRAAIAMAARFGGSHE